MNETRNIFKSAHESSEIHHAGMIDPESLAQFAEWLEYSCQKGMVTQ